MLKNQSYIEHSIVSFYTTKEQGASMVKVGGYDEFCMSDPKEFEMFSTVNNDEWVLGANWGRVGGKGNVLF